eukprot:CAMPEP_0113463154 /NCGR_PEP_ID=MMETSP0014_2-20120614/12489_1 /TAXON_ID=2857 /ORGANISM="Nitzschia sp." /LENGTH=66 /DNA_ID=CAMNT_0000355095 /DNA_START=23 /DNA_END=223 /DNA_ORIENTATION=+ /assembly_acc=CAM_ASM_000159
MNLLERVRSSGKIPPSLLTTVDNADEQFEAAVMKVSSSNEGDLLLASGADVAADFDNLLQVRKGRM